MSILNEVYIKPVGVQGESIFMNKVLSIILIATIVCVLTGCSNSTEIKAIEQGKLSLANLEYEKALGSFKLAISEGTKNEEINKLVQIIEVFYSSKNLIEENKMEEAKAILAGVDKSYINYAIKGDIETLREEIRTYEENNIVIEEKLEVIEKLISEGRYKDAKVIIDEILSGYTSKSELLKEKIDIQVKIIKDELVKREKEAIKANKEITNDEIMKVIINCDKRCMEVLSMPEGRSIEIAGEQYIAKEEKFNTYKKIRDYLAPYCSEEVINATFKMMKEVDGVLYIYASNMGETLDYTRGKILKVSDYSNTKSVVLVAPSNASSENIEERFTLVYENNRWLVDSPEYLGL